MRCKISAPSSESGPGCEQLSFLADLVAPYLSTNQDSETSDQILEYILQASALYLTGINQGFFKLSFENSPGMGSCGLAPLAVSPE